MSKLVASAKQYLEYQLSVIPTREGKRPAITWEPYQSSRMTDQEVEQTFTRSSVEGIGIICGAISGDLEVIDVDTKYDLTGTLWEEFKELIEGTLPDVWETLVVAQTRSGGYHIYYKCSEVSGNLKLANRPTSAEEREATYKREVETGATEEKAMRGAENDRVRVLLETRGEGGLVVAYPTPGYTYIQGDPSSIPTITPEERRTLHAIARSFDQPPAQEEASKRTGTTTSTTTSSEGSPFEDYNKRGDVIALLEEHGWQVVNRRAERVHLLRPGQTDSKTSGNYHTEKRTFYVWSSSTQFEAGKGYSPSTVFKILVCDGDGTKAAKELIKLGYGKAYTASNKVPNELKTERITVSRVDSVNKETSVISTPGEMLKIDELEGEEVLITSPGAEATQEVLEAIKRINGKRIYIKEQDVEVREYRYQLNAIFEKYGEIQDIQNGLLDRDKHSLLDEVIEVSTRLSPIDKAIFLKEFTSQDAIQELGITEESLSITVDRLTATRDKEEQSKQLKGLLSEASQLHEKGDTEKALGLLDEKVREVKLKDKVTEFSKLLTTTTEDKIKEEESNAPDGLNSGFTIDGDELLLAGGAISVFAAPTNHGKTLMLINTLLNVAKDNPGKKYVFLTYEEGDNTIIQYFLNTYMDIDLNSSDKANRRLLKGYFKTGSTQYIARDKQKEFQAKKAEFFKDYIETGRILIKYVDFDSSALCTAIHYLKKQPDIAGIFIDYFQLLKLPQDKYKNYGSRQDELKQICIALKDVAKKTGLPLVLAAQFNREATNLMRLHPTNVSEAGDIERIVHTLIGLWSMHKKIVLKGITKEEGQEINKRTQGAKKGMFVEVLKSRDIASGKYEVLDFNGNTGKIKNSKNSTDTADSQSFFDE